MPDEKTLQVILPAAEAAGFKALADQLGVSVSAYLRRLILARGVPWVAAHWIDDMNAAPTPVAKYDMMRARGEDLLGSAPHFLLEFVESSRDEYLVFDKHGRHYTDLELRAGTNVWRGRDGGRLVLAGAPDLWIIERSIANARAGGQLRWRLERWLKPAD